MPDVVMCDHTEQVLSLNACDVIACVQDLRDRSRIAAGQ